MKNKVTTLSEFIVERQGDFPYAKGELSRLLGSIQLAAKIVNREVNKAGLVDIIGEQGEKNVQGENQQKLDVFANRHFIEAMENQGEVCGIASEENESFIAYESEFARDGKYIVMIDPLDGSSNIDVNVSIGTIFSIYRRIPKPGLATMEDFLQPGTKQIAAGYIIYGSSTMLVYTTGNGVYGFTLDPSIGVFCLSHPRMKFPRTGKIYSTNQGNFVHYPEGIKQYIKYCQEEDKLTNRPYSCRYIGSLVADFHRNMIKGGIFLYPQTFQNKNGKLRLLYECNPLSMIAEQAGGKATDGVRRILEIYPTGLHQRTPFLVGSVEMVEQAEAFLRKYSEIPA